MISYIKFFLFKLLGSFYFPIGPSLKFLMFGKCMESNTYNLLI